LDLLAGGAAVGVLVWLLGYEHAHQLADVANKIALTVATIVRSRAVLVAEEPRRW